MQSALGGRCNALQSKLEGLFNGLLECADERALFLMFELA